MEEPEILDDKTFVLYFMKRDCKSRTYNLIKEDKYRFDGKEPLLNDLKAKCRELLCLE
jgi:hypothetical protein